MKKIYISIIALTISSLFTACGREESLGIKNDSAVEVSVQRVNELEVPEFIKASGSLQAINSANVSTRMMGHVIRLNVKVGQEVKKGDMLLHINSKDLQAKKYQVEAGIQQAQSAYDNAAKDYERFKILHKNESASDKELENITIQYEMSKAGLDRAKELKNEVIAQFDYLIIKAPFSGVIINTFIKEGNLAKPGYPLIAIESTEDFEAQLMVSEEDIDMLEEGLKASIHLKSSNRFIDGVVSELSRSSKNTGGQYLVKVKIEGKDSTILAGMFVNAQIEIKGESSLSKVMVPKSALVYKGQLKGLYTIGDGDVALLRWLRLGKQIDDQVEVLSGLSKGESYITEAKSKLYNGVQVKF